VGGVIVNVPQGAHCRVYIDDRLAWTDPDDDVAAVLLGYEIRLSDDPDDWTRLPPADVTAIYGITPDLKLDDVPTAPPMGDQGDHGPTRPQTAPPAAP